MVISSTTEQVYASIDITDIVTYRTERVKVKINTLSMGNYKEHITQEKNCHSTTVVELL